MIKTFQDRHGFARADITLANWRTAPFSRWSFQNVRDLVPTAAIAAEVPMAEVPLESAAFLDTPMETGLAGAATARAFSPGTSQPSMADVTRRVRPTVAAAATSRSASNTASCS